MDGGCSLERLAGLGVVPLDGVALLVLLLGQGPHPPDGVHLQLVVHPRVLTDRQTDGQARTSRREESSGGGCCHDKASTAWSGAEGGASSSSYRRLELLCGLGEGLVDGLVVRRLEQRDLTTTNMTGRTRVKQAKGGQLDGDDGLLWLYLGVLVEREEACWRDGSAGRDAGQLPQHKQVGRQGR